MLFATVIVAIVFNAANLAPRTAADDRALIYLSLKVFARDADELLSRTEGLLLIDPMSASLNDFPPSDAQGDCGALLEFKDSLAARNSSPANMEEWIPASAQWRLASPQEVEAPLFRLDRSVARTKLRFLAPAYAADGQTALVALSFVDGQHVARVNFVFDRSGRGWSEKCIDLQRWP